VLLSHPKVGDAAVFGIPHPDWGEEIKAVIEPEVGNEPGDALTGTATLNGGSTGHPNGNGHANGNGHSNGHANGNGHSNGIGHAKPTACDENGQRDIKDCCADGVAESTAKLADRREIMGTSGASSGSGGAIGASTHSDEPQNFEEFIYKVWGAGIAKHFAIPYNRKIWAVDLKEMETSWLGGRVPLPDLEEMIQGALEPVPAPMGPNARFGYPLKGGFQSLMNGFLPHIKNSLMLETRIVGCSPKNKTLTLSTGKKVRYEQLISTMPLPVLIRMAGAEVPVEVRKAAAGLRHTSVKCVNIGVGRENITEKHWIYYPEDSVFHRIFVQGNASPHCNPPGGFGFTCEITYSPQKPLPCDGEELIKLCIKDAVRVGFIKESDPILCANVVDMPYAYVVYDHPRKKSIAVIKEWLAKHDIILVGRYSEWEYFNSNHAFLAGKRGAEEARAGLAEKKTPAARATPSRIRDASERAAEKGWSPASPRTNTDGTTIKDEVV